MSKYLTELHLHTKESSLCSEIPAKQMIEEYKKQGYSTIVITDHCSKSKFSILGEATWVEKIDYMYKGFDIAKEYGSNLGINILLGVEIKLQLSNNKYSEYLIYGIDRDFLYENENIYDYTLEKLYKICNKKGYLVVQAHPFRDNVQLAQLEYIDGIEVFNGCQNEISRNDKALEYGNSTNKILTSGSDFHRLDDLARGGIITNIEIKDINKLVEILKSREYELIKDRHKMKESIQS